MKKKQRYSISFYDESRLEQKWKFRFSRGGGLLLFVALFLGMVMAGALAVSLTPARSLLPGYLQKEDRNTAEEMLLRLDSLQKEMDTRQKYISNLLAIFDGNRDPRDTILTQAPVRGLTASDSLLGPSQREQDFVKMMREQERTRHRDGLKSVESGATFFPVAGASVVTSDSRSGLKARIAVARGEEICAIADGTVVAAYRASHEPGQILIIQHTNGYLSRYSRLGRTLVGIGEKVDGGETIAMPPSGRGVNGDYIELEMWFRGDPVKPGLIFQQPEE